MPTRFPTRDPTQDPTRDPTQIPTRFPTRDPTQIPTLFPSTNPTRTPTNEPTVPSYSPSAMPTATPTPKPTGEAAFLFSMGSRTTMELSIAVSVLLVSLCFVCVAVFCLCVVRKHMKPAYSAFSTRQEMESVIYADDDAHLRATDHDGSAQWEINIVTDENERELSPTNVLETDHETMTQSEAGPSSRGRSPFGQKRRMGRSKRAKRRGYASVEMEAVEREAVEVGGADTLGVLNFGGFTSSVSPPSKELSILHKKISVKDVRPAFYVPGMSSLSSMPIPPQPNQHRLAMLCKPRENEREIEREEIESVAPSSAVSALSDVSASTRHRKDTNLST